MSAPGLAANPLARLLLDLAYRGADGSVRLGGRRVLLHRGKVVDVEATDDDESLEEFLLGAGRISTGDLERTRSEARATGLDTAEALVRSGHIADKTLRDARRALWLDRLVRGLAAVEESGAGPPPFEPEAPTRQGLEGISTVRLVLDALARRAALGDAEAVGARADHRLMWIDGPHTEVARRWSELGETVTRHRLAHTLARVPDSPSRVAALVRAGLARLALVEGSAPPPPPDRPAPLAPPGPVRTGGTARMTAIKSDSLPPPREPTVRLEPGAAGLPAPGPSARLTTPLWRLPPATSPFGDPLDPVERRIANLEQIDAAGPERAAAWRELARIWQRHYGSLAEAARAWREAAAADPSDLEALDEAAVLCAATGRLDLATAYTSAAVSAATAPEERGRALRRSAEMAARTGDADAALAALRAATTADPQDPYAPEWLARLAHRRGDPREAVQAARTAAQRVRESRPDRGRGLLAWACTLDPDDVELLEHSATALVQDGYAEAAVTLLTEAARDARDDDERRRLVLDAAERAEFAGRHDLAAGLLLDAFDAEPHVDVLHEPLATDLEAAGDATMLAVVLEDVAAAAPPEQRGGWLARAARAHTMLAGGKDWALELLTCALELEPDETSHLEQLHDLAVGVRDETILADALERGARAASRARKLGSASRLLTELAKLAEERLGSAHRALWAIERLAELFPDEARDPGRVAQLERLRSKVRVKTGPLSLAEQDVEQAPPSARARAARKLAAMLRDQPAQRRRAIALYREALAANPHDHTAASSLERLLRLEHEDHSLSELLRARLDRSPEPAEQTRILVWLAALDRRRGDLHASARSCLQLLEAQPDHRLAAARLERAARRLDDPTLRHATLRHRIALATAPREQGRAYAALALLLEAEGEPNAALESARRALEADPKAADAVALRLRHIEELPPSDSVATIDSARRALGDSPPLLDLGTRLAKQVGDATAVQRYLEAWHGLAPSDPAVARMRLQEALAAEDAARVLEVAGEALAPDVIDERTPNAIHTALERLEALGATAEAASLAVLAIDRIGADELLPLAEWLADASGGHEGRVAALERIIARAPRGERPETLRKLASLYRDRGDRSAEARTLLRVLATDPHDGPTLDRLAGLYAEAGETDRLMAVLALRLEGAHDALERRQRLLDLAAASAEAARDLDRAERFLATMIDEAAEEEKLDVILEGAGALVSLGRPERAISLLLDLAVHAPPARLTALCEHAVILAEHEARDAWLALRTATRALSMAPDNPTLLIAFERLALELGDVATAKKTYETLLGQALGRHGRRALLYRLARWLERAGDADAALRAYVRAFDEEPGSGVIFGNIERLAADLADFEPLVHACLTVAKLNPQAGRRVQLVRRAAELSDRELGDAGRALAALEEVWRDTGRLDLLPELRRLASRVAESDGASADQVRRGIATTLEEWAEQTWDGAARTELLGAAVSIHTWDLDDLVRAEACASQLVDLAKQEEDVPAAAAATALCTVAERFADRSELDAAWSAASRAREVDPSHARAQALAARLEEQREAEAAEMVPGPEVAVQPPERGPAVGSNATGALEAVPMEREPQLHLDPGTRDLDPGTRDPAPMPELPAGLIPDSHANGADAAAPVNGSEAAQLADPELTPLVRSYPPEPRARVRAPPDGLDAREAALREASRGGDLAATEQLAHLLADDPARLREAEHLLLQVARDDPTRLETLRLLQSAAADRGARALEGTTAAIRSLFDPAMAAPDEGDAEDCARYLDDASSAVREVGLAMGTTALRVVWETAKLLFRRNLRDYGLIGTDRIAPVGNRPLARALARALDVLSPGEIGLYVSDSTGSAIVIAPTHPPSVLAGPQLEQAHEVEMRFRVARGVELARPDHVLLSTRSAAEARTLIDAVRAAFGPPATARDVGRDAVALAADLWRTIPARSQSHLRELVVQGLPDYEQLLAHSRAAAARAGLVVAGAIRPSVQALAADDPDLDGPALRAGCVDPAVIRSSPAAMALLRFALSDAYLAARSRALAGR